MPLRVLLSEEQIREGVENLAARIRADYGDEEILLVGVLKGCVYLMADLSRALGENVQVDFVQVSSYGKERSSSGIVRILKDLDISLEGRHVLIVEDIIDTGTTLEHLRELFGTRNPRSIRVAALLTKPEARKVQSSIDYVAFEIPNEFVVGYGLDDAERYRNLPYVAVLHD